MKKLSFLIQLSACVVFLASGCSTIIDARKQKAPYMATYYSGNLKGAAADLTGKAADREETGDELMWRLDEGTADFTAGEYEKSLKAFERCEAIIKDFDDRAVVSARDGGAEGSSVVTNPNTLPYKGMYLDRVMLNAYKALDYFALGEPDSAQVELRRMRYNQKQVVKQFDNEIQKSQKEIDSQNRTNQQKSNKLGGQKSSITFADIIKNPLVNKAYSESGKKANKLYGNLSNPFCTYFSAMGYLIDGNKGEAMVDFRNLYKMLPQNRLIQRDYVTCAKSIGDPIPKELQKVKPYDYPLTKQIVYVVLLNGRAPALKQMKFQIILPFVGYTGVAFPRYEYFKSPFPGLEVDYKFKKKSQSAKTIQVTNFDYIMSQEYHERLPGMITRIVISTLTKEIASYAAVRAAREAGGTGAQIGAYALTGLYKWAFNTADTRCWETLPQEVQITHVPIPDDRKLLISPIGAGQKATAEKTNASIKQITHCRQTTEIKLKKDTRVAIVFVRALSADKVIYKLFEIKKGQ